MGDHALVSLSATYIMVHEHPKISAKPAFQQSHMILFIFTFYEVAQSAIGGGSGHPGDPSALLGQEI